MLVLGIETSQRPGTVALCDASTCLDERPLELPNQQHAQALPSVVAALFSDHSRLIDDLALLAVSHGPGSFTGLRVGMAFAKTLAWATGCPLVPVDTFVAIATDAPDDVDSLYVVADAHRQELFTRHYRRGADRQWTPTGEFAIESAQAWCRSRQPGDAIAGPALSSILDQLPDHVRPITLETSLPRAQAIATLGRRDHQAGRHAEIATLEPFYLRRSAAEENRETRRAASTS
ncbi:MAG: tRNA (adenosine(37)-N6)-threonylcarbamoyltransferase complex dimerization subunit type 1 TsaB [Planctomycetaceae bacterium]|jgi:tRNA threonylcarbamoyladenosine biosynthesis protein TsaB|nr:tRNA (adenosine(37)-N6)-threonylcarbamoyltransferase complex dimerization subunit type 1 TsaB [Planctomycetaceae bacterium]